MMVEFMAWCVVWITMVAACAFLGAFIGAVIGKLKKVNIEETSGRWASKGIAFGFFTPLLYWWWLAAVWAYEKVI